MTLTQLGHMANINGLSPFLGALQLLNLAGSEAACTNNICDQL